MTKFTQEQIRELWGTGKAIDGFTVHRMSYGDYFTQPTTWRGGEKDGFSSKTKWFTKVIENKKVYYTLE